jgi:FkbM family methyltransferase
VIHDWVGSVKLVVETGMTGATGNLYCGLHEFEDMGLLLHLLRPEDGFVDIGANIGSYTVLASGMIGTRTCSFEPHPDTFKRLSRNILINGIESRAELVQSAVGSKAGTIRFTADLDTMNQVVDEAYTGDTIDVPVKTLDEALEGFESTLWKIDVEGFEDEVVAGAQEQLKCESLNAILLESESPRIVESLIRNQFERVAYDPFQRRFIESAQRNGNNMLWIRDRAFCENRVKSAPKIEVFGVSI